MNIKFVKWIFLIPVILIQGCFDIPDAVVMPSWDASLSIPITNYTYTLLDAVKDDSTLIYSEDAGDYGLIYYSSVNPLDTLYFTDDIAIDPFSTSVRDSLGDVKIDDVDPVKIAVRVEDWTDNVKSGSYQDFPENTGAILFPFDKIHQFREISISSGFMNVNINNILPVDVELQGMIIRNAETKELIIEKYMDDIVLIKAESDTNLAFDLSGKIVKDSLEYLGVFYTEGSHGEERQIPEQAGTEITASFSSLVITRAVAPIPRQEPISIAEAVEPDDSTFIENALISKGSFSINISNGFAVNMNTTITFDELHDETGNPYSVQREIPANGNITIREEHLHGWKIISNGGREIHYSTVADVYSSNGQVIEINSTDAVQVDVNFNKMYLTTFTGQIKPTSVVFDELRMRSGLDSLNDAFQFTSLKISDKANIFLNLAASSSADILVNTHLMVSNGHPEQRKQVDLGNILINSSTPSRIDLKELGLLDIISSFSGDLPTLFVITGTAVINPEYKSNITVAASDVVVPTLDFEVPLEFNVSGGDIVDTTDLKIDSKDDINKIKSAELSLNLSNTIPADVIFNGTVIDSAGNEILTIPPSHNELDSVIIPPPTYSGSTTIPGTVEQTILLTEADADEIVRGARFVMHFRFDTKGRDVANLVKLKIQDYINVKMFGKVTYEVSDKND